MAWLYKPGDKVEVRPAEGDEWIPGEVEGVGPSGYVCVRIDQSKTPKGMWYTTAFCQDDVRPAWVPPDPDDDICVYVTDSLGGVWYNQGKARYIDANRLKRETENQLWRRVKSPEWTPPAVFDIIERPKLFTGEWAPHVVTAYDVLVKEDEGLSWRRTGKRMSVEEIKR